MEDKESASTIKSEIDYKTLWENSENKLAQQTERFQKKVIKLVHEQETIQEKFDNLTKEHEAIKNSITNEKQSESNMHSLMTIPSSDNSERDVPTFRQPSVVQSRQTSFAQGSRIKEIRDPFVLTQRKRRGSLFGAKPVGKDGKRCEYPRCNSKSVDLILCSQCQKYVCEECNDVPILKLKILMDKCPTIYFICRKCNQAKLDGSDTVQSSFASSNIDENEIINSLRRSLEKEMRDLEYKFERLIDQLVDRKIEKISYRLRENNYEENPASRKMSKDDNFMVETRNRHRDDYLRRPYEQSTMQKQRIDNSKAKQEARVEKETCQCTDCQPAQKPKTQCIRWQEQTQDTPKTPTNVPIEAPLKCGSMCCNGVGTQYGNGINNPMPGQANNGMNVGVTPLTASRNLGTFVGGQPMYDNEVIRRFLENIAIENQLKGMSFNQNHRPDGEKVITLKEMIRRPSN